MAPLDGAHVDFALTHELLNDIGAQHIVKAKFQSAPYRQSIRSQGRFPTGQILRVLAEAVADVTDGADAETDEVSIDMGRIAHEVTVQSTANLCFGEVILGQCEMFHANVAIAGSCQFLYRQPPQGKPTLRSGQLLRLDLPLRLEEFGDMGVAVNGKPIGPYLDNGFQCLLEALEGLPRQAVDQVDVDGAKAAVAAGFDYCKGLFDALYVLRD